MVYHETQKFQYCAIHAVNALLGYAAFTVQDFEQVAKQLGKEMGNFGQQQYRSPWGLGLEIEWQDKRVTLQLERFRDPNMIGLLINVYIRRWWRFWGSSRHWCTIKLIEDKYYLLDSFNQSPIVWKEQYCG
ncbi:Josephin-2 [Galdieria sulphuraria]|nr:Josephin-2 [Galdieria sulphuraria]